MGTEVANSTCPKPMKATSNGIFQGEHPLDAALPLAIVQICLVVALTRILAFFLKPLRQPRVIAEIIGGVLLGPSALGRNKAYLDTIFPARSLTVLDTLANLGLLFFLFLVGLELDMKSLRRAGKKALLIAIAGISLPFILGIGTSVVLRATISKGVANAPFLVFMGVALSITAFPVLARILAELKLLTTDVGRMAMSAAAVNDVAAWILLALAIALSGAGHSPLVSLWVFLAGVGFVSVCVVIVPLTFQKMADRCTEGEPVNELYICLTLASVLFAGFCTDLIGIHALFGAFILGALMPKEGPFAGAMVEKVEDFVSGLFLPLYFVSSGLKTNVATIQGAQSWGLLVLVIFTACFGKILGTVAVSLASRVPLQEALALGFLMNTKGLVELIVLNIGKERKVLNDQTFAIMVLMALFTTFITTPLVMAVYKPAKRAGKSEYKNRTIERKEKNTGSGSGSELRILTCFHSASNLPTIINLIEASRGSDKKEALCVYAMHLMELSERSSAILMVHKARKNGMPFWNKKLSGSNQIIVAFEAFRQLCRVTIRPMTAISHLSNIHEDICSTAERKMVSIIILPFHKHQSFDGSFETTRHEFGLINQRVLEHAPCSVGILIDRGLGGSSHVQASNVSSDITVLFFGGPDDREALAYGLRMAEHPGIVLKVIHFILASGTPKESTNLDIDESLERQPNPADARAVSAFKKRVTEDGSIKYEEITIKSADEVIDVIQEHAQSNMFLVGRMSDGQAISGLNVRNECPELGAVGNLLSSPEIKTQASVLIIQQYYQEKPSLSWSDSSVREVGNSSATDGDSESS